MELWTNPFREMERLRRNIDRVFEGSGVGRWDFPFSRISFLPGLAAREYPLINIAEEGDALRIEAMAPGVDPKSLNVSVVGNQLSLSGEKQPSNGAAPEAFHRKERWAGKFMRKIELPCEVDEGRVDAEYKNGILEIHLPKAAAAKPRQISVSVA
jgi:HSP20 family protein